MQVETVEDSWMPDSNQDFKKKRKELWDHHYAYAHNQQKPYKKNRALFLIFQEFSFIHESPVSYLDFKQCIIFLQVHDTNLLKENILEASHFRLNIFCFMGKMKANYNAYHTYYDKWNRHAKGFSCKAVKHYQITWKYTSNTAKQTTYEK